MPDKLSLGSQPKLFGPETEKAINNFQFSGLNFPREFIAALGNLKACCAEVNQELGLLEEYKAQAIVKAARDVADGQYDAQFPIDIFQTGSGTSTNMNANEVIAAIANKGLSGEQLVHPNDDVNMGQSSNDVIPSCIHISAVWQIKHLLRPANEHLIGSLQHFADQYADVMKTGRTHLMDAMPLSIAQEVSGWVGQLEFTHRQFCNEMTNLCGLAIGGTAVGTGVNTSRQFSKLVTEKLSSHLTIPFCPAENHFRANSAQDAAVSMSGTLKTAAVSLTKITNDIRWMSSGPQNGLNELHLPELQKGSSIMPGKVNPVIPEAVLMACAQVMGNDLTISLAAQSGNFQLNTMLPVIAYNLLQSIQLISASCTHLADKVIKDMKVNESHLEKNLQRNPILATALNKVIGYDKSAEIARKAYAENRDVLAVAKELTDISEGDLKKLLDPGNLNKPFN